jgi:hypothetical protein
MSYSETSLLEKSSGKVGNTIFYTWNEEVYARAKPVKVTNPQTNQQQANRKNLGFIVNAFRQLRPLLIISLNNRPENRHAYHEFLSLNLNHSIVMGVFYPENLVLAPPHIQSTDFVINRLIEDSNKFSLKWESTVSGNQSSTDKLYAAIYSPIVNEFGYIISGIYRNTGNATLEFNQVFKNVPCFVYAFFVRSDITYASVNSVHSFDAIT